MAHTTRFLRPRPVAVAFGVTNFVPTQRFHSVARSHSHGGVVCEHPTRKACNLARKVSLGQCSEMIESKNEPHPCPHWAVEKVGERGYCGQHVGSVIRAEDDRQRNESRRAAQYARIEAYLAWRLEHPSVWDRMPLS